MRNRRAIVAVGGWTMSAAAGGGVARRHGGRHRSTCRTRLGAAFYRTAVCVYDSDDNVFEAMAAPGRVLFQGGGGSWNTVCEIAVT